MRLALFSSRKGVSEPNHVAVQDPTLDMLPTVLVCPVRADEPVTPLRVEVTVGNRRCLVLCELARPVHRRGLTPAGVLNESDSRRVMETFGVLLAR